MKKYLQFIKEAEDQKMIDVKQDIADKIASETTDDNNLDKMEPDIKPNPEIKKVAEETIENFEKQKDLLNKTIDEINNKVNYFNSQLDLEKNAQTPNKDKIKEVENLIKKYEEELNKFNLQIKTAEEQRNNYEKSNQLIIKK